MNPKAKERVKQVRMAIAAPGQLNITESPSWGSRSVDCFEKLEQIGEGTYGWVHVYTFTLFLYLQKYGLNIFHSLQARCGWNILLWIRLSSLPKMRVTSPFCASLLYERPLSKNWLKLWHDRPNFPWLLVAKTGISMKVG